MDIVSLFLEGLLSFLSPCVLPLVPLYMSYLSSDGREEINGQIKYRTPKVFLMTVFFVLGISVVFIVLALSLDILKPLINDYSAYIALVGGLIIIVFGLQEVGIINIKFLNNEKRIKASLTTKQMNYFKAFALGFFFAFAWTPCIGPMLSSAIIIAASSKLGSLYILVYALGLIIPFLITGLFTSTILNFIKEKKNISKYVLIVAGIIMIGYGCYMVYNSIVDLKTIKVNNTASDETKETEYYVDDYEFTCADGSTVNLSTYNGNYIMLNFSTTWCTYCQSEIPEYLEYAKNNNECVCFYVLSSGTSGVTIEELLSYVNEQSIDIPVILDEEGRLPSVSAYPTLYIIGTDGKYLGYRSGALNLEGFKETLELAKERE